MPLLVSFVQNHLASKSADISKIKSGGSAAKRASKPVVQAAKEATLKAKKSKKGETKTK